MSSSLENHRKDLESRIRDIHASRWWPVFLIVTAREKARVYEELAVQFRDEVLVRDKDLHQTLVLLASCRLPRRTLQYRNRRQRHDKEIFTMNLKNMSQSYIPIVRGVLMVSV
jgi:hypothetical protein